MGSFWDERLPAEARGRKASGWEVLSSDAMMLRIPKQLQESRHIQQFEDELPGGHAWICYGHATSRDVHAARSSAQGARGGHG